MSTFVITGPNTLTASNFNYLAGSLTAGAGVPASLATNCQTDTFSVTSPGGGTVPAAICGTNTGYHSK